MPTNYDYFRAASKSVVPVKSRGGDSSLKLGRQSRGRESPSGIQGQSPGRGSGKRIPPGAEALLRNCTVFFVSALTYFIGLVICYTTKTLMIAEGHN